MFSAPRYVIKDGKFIIRDHEFCSDHSGRLLHVAPEYDKGIEDVIRPFFEDNYSMRFDNYAVTDDFMPQNQVVPIKG